MWYLLLRCTVTAGLPVSLTRREDRTKSRNPGQPDESSVRPHARQDGTALGSAAQAGCDAICGTARCNEFAFAQFGPTPTNSGCCMQARETPP